VGWSEAFEHDDRGVSVNWPIVIPLGLPKLPKFNISRSVAAGKPPLAGVDPLIEPVQNQKQRCAWSWAPPSLLLIGSVLVAAPVALRPHDARRVAAIFPPWWTAEQSLTAASGVAAVTGLGVLPFIVEVGRSQAGLEKELRDAGAVIIVDGSRFAFCGGGK
jgi:hypothetical protein